MEGKFVDINGYIDDIDDSSIYPSLMKEFMMMPDNDGKIKCFEATPQNVVADYIESHREDFVKILNALDYEIIVSIYGEVANKSDVLKYYTFEDAFSKYYDWIVKQESIKTDRNKYGFDFELLKNYRKLEIITTEE